MNEKGSFTHIEVILLLTAFAAGAVDVISFATLGGVFASAMTGNFALLAYYVAQSDAQSAMGSVVALSGFVLGCALGVLQRRSRAQGQALSLLLTTEAGLLLFFALYAMWTPHVAHAPSDHLQILLLAVAMGVQAVIGQTISLTTIVFTTTLTKLVGTIADSLANGDALGLKDVKIQSAVVVSYLFGALLAGALVVHNAEAVVLLPFVGVALSLAVHRWSGRSAAPRR
ncbi:MAG TPA: YoaK family protein [Steroidobacteraceae bacterium]|nr:YoaK family protein [Steroidobacteraceae bacterium]